MGASSRGSVRISLTVVPKFAVRPLKNISRKGFGTWAGSNDEICVDGNMAPASYSVLKVAGDGLVVASPPYPAAGLGCVALSEADAGSADGTSAAELPRGHDPSSTITLVIAAQ